MEERKKEKNENTSRDTSFRFVGIIVKLPANLDDFACCVCMSTYKRNM